MSIINTLPFLGFFFIGQIAALYFISRQTINNLFGFIRLFIHNDKVVFSLVSVIFLPGTFVHESAHFLAAIVLVLRVRGMNLFPQFTGNYIKLGSVEYEKKDAFRGFLVGIAPIFVGIGILWVIPFFKLFPSNNILWNIFIAYIIFAISSTMFSSAKDMQDLAIVIPVIIIMVGIYYIFNIRLDIIWKNKELVSRLIGISREIDLYLFFSIIIHISLIFLLKCLNSWFSR